MQGDHIYFFCVSAIWTNNIHSLVLNLKSSYCRCSMWTRRRILRWTLASLYQMSKPNIHNNTIINYKLEIKNNIQLLTLSIKFSGDLWVDWSRSDNDVKQVPNYISVRLYATTFQLYSIIFNYISPWFQTFLSKLLCVNYFTSIFILILNT